MEIMSYNRFNERIKEIGSWCENNNCFLSIMKGINGVPEYLSLFGSHGTVSHIKELKVPEGVHEIPEGAFIGGNWDDLCSITLPKSIILIEKMSMRKSVTLTVPIDIENKDVIYNLIDNGFKFHVSFPASVEIMDGISISDEICHHIIRNIVFSKFKLSKKEMLKLSKDTHREIKRRVCERRMKNEQARNNCMLLIKICSNLLQIFNEWTKDTKKLEKLRRSTDMIWLDIDPVVRAYKELKEHKNPRRLSYDVSIVNAYGQLYDRIGECEKEINTYIKRLMNFDLNNISIH